LAIALTFAGPLGLRGLRMYYFLRVRALMRRFAPATALAWRCLAVRNSTRLTIADLLVAIL
jgi:hypothetical protein